MTCVRDSLLRMPGLHKPRRRFLEALLALLLALPGRATFRNMSRYSPYCQHTFARHFSQHFDFAAFNYNLAAPLLGPRLAIATDTTFVAKAGRRTYGLDHFFDSTVRRPRRGLEVSTTALIDLDSGTAFALSARQTPCVERTEPPTTQQQRRAFYLRHVLDDIARLPCPVAWVLADGHYATVAFLEGVLAQGVEVITRLRCDANLRFLFQGPHPKRRGAKRKYAGKVDLQDRSGLAYVGLLEPGIELYTAVVNSPHFKRTFRIAYIYHRASDRYVVLASTDLAVEAQEIVRLYRLRFQLEFLFRDAKQHTGFSHCQARSAAKLGFHFNASLSAVNVARREAGHRGERPFSMVSRKRISFNELYLDRIIEHLGLAPEFVRLHPAYEFLRTYGAIAA